MSSRNLLTLSTNGLTRFNFLFAFAIGISYFLKSYWNLSKMSSVIGRVRRFACSWSLTSSVNSSSNSCFEYWMKFIFIYSICVSPTNLRRITLKGGSFNKESLNLSNNSLMGSSPPNYVNMSSLLPSSCRLTIDYDDYGTGEAILYMYSYDLSKNVLITFSTIIFSDDFTLTLSDISCSSILYTIKSVIWCPLSVWRTFSMNYALLVMPNCFWISVKSLFWKRWEKYMK